ncbi:MAG: hypothetical protein HQ581_04100 [Planctomycetes bacterium]|nr:hypothetical protein [Planctomycetota bacterium]
MTSSIFSVTDGLLRIAGQVIDTPFPVAQAIQAEDRVIVRLEVPTGVVKSGNVICYDRNGTLLWTVQESPHGGVEDNPFVSIKIDDAGKLTAEIFSGVAYGINVDDGMISVSGFRRF